MPAASIAPGKGEYAPFGPSHLVEASHPANAWFTTAQVKASAYLNSVIRLPSGELYERHSSAPNLVNCLETGRATSYYRWGTVINRGDITAQYASAGSYYCPKTLIAGFELNTWYVLVLKLDHDANSSSELFRTEVYKKANPGIRGYYTRDMVDGLSWRFHHWIYTSGTHSYLDNYYERTISSDVVYVGNLYEKDLTPNPDVETKYYYLGSSRIAMRKAGVVSYILTDNLGSTVASCDATCSAASLVNRRYYSYGEPRYTTGTMPSQRLFTGQLFDEALGLYYYGARWYDPYIASYSSPDSVVPDPGNPQALNRYSYVLNNPLKYVDCNGHFPILPILLAAAVVGGGGFAWLSTAPAVNAPTLDDSSVKTDYTEQDRAMLGVIPQDVQSGNWGMVGLGLLNYVPGGRYLKQAKALVPEIRALAESRALRGSVPRLASALERGAPGAVFQAQRTLHYWADLVGMEYRELFNGRVGYLDIVLSGNRVVDPKDWTGWAGHSASEQVAMLRHLRQQTQKYLGNANYSLKFEFKGFIPEPALQELAELQKIYGERLSWEVIP